MERHPENGPPYNILLGQFGRRIHPADPPVAAILGATYFPETGHNVTRAEFVAFWQVNGGLAQFGFPLSEEFTERSDLDGKTYTMQYFERAVFELHPENEAPFDVLLSQLGTFRYREKYATAGATTTPRPSRSPTAGPVAVTGTWAEAAPMLLYRSEHGAAVLDGKIYVAGGFSGGSNIFQTVAREVEVYDPAAGTFLSRGRLCAS